MANTKASELTIITSTLNANTINEKTSAAGVTVDSVLLKDGAITVSNTGEMTSGVAKSTSGTGYASYVNGIASSCTVILSDLQRVDITMVAPAYCCMVMVSNNSAVGGLFFLDLDSSTVIKLADPSGSFGVTDAGTLAAVVYKSASSTTFSVKNRQGIIRGYTIRVFGAKVTVSDPI